MRSLHFKIATLAFLALACSSAFAETYGLIVGINDYPTPKNSRGEELKDENGQVRNNDLRGAVNDAKKIQWLLETAYGAKKSNLHMITDAAVTGDKFISELKWLLSAVKPGDQIVFYFSGHGTQIPGGDEADKMDEGLCLADGQVVTDDLMGDLKTVVQSMGVNATYMFDSCFSGGMSRNGFKTKAIDKPNFGANYKFIPNFKFTPLLTNAKNAARKSAQDGVKPGEFAFIFASQEGIPSIDFPGTEELPAHGLFTLAVSAVLEEDPKLGAKDIVDAMAQFFEETFKDVKEIEQRPQSEFSTPTRARLPIFLQ